MGRKGWRFKDGWLWLDRLNLRVKAWCDVYYERVDFRSKGRLRVVFEYFWVLVRRGHLVYEQKVEDLESLERLVIQGIS